MTKYIFVTGGVVSSLGKGLAASSIGSLLEARALKVSLIKLDPYINVDPGTMSPFQHGEVFVTDDGAETDLDLGHYERFIDRSLAQANATRLAKSRLCGFRAKMAPVSAYGLVESTSSRVSDQRAVSVPPSTRPP